MVEREAAASARFSRRQVLAAGGLIAGATAAGGVGSLVIGDGFEKHVGRVLGISPELAAALTARARAALGSAQYELQAAEFTLATRFPGTLLPSGVRENAIRELVVSMIDSAAENAAYVGLIPAGELSSPCAGLGSP